MEKTLICVSGTSTSGKTSLAKMFLQGAFSNDIFFIPHTTSRLPREDDIPELIRTLNHEGFEREAFFSKDDNYGTLLSDIQEFMDSKSSIGFSIVSCYEKPDMLKNIESNYKGVIKLFNIVTRLSNSIDGEFKLLEKRLPQFHSPEVEKQRVEWNKMFCEECFYNASYLDQYIDLILSQSDGDLSTWCKRIESENQTLHLNGDVKLEAISLEVCTKLDVQRKLF